MPDQLKHYLQKIEQALRAGNATEHTHRPTLKALREALDLSMTATNEPKRIACGAPDYVVTRDGLIVGYIEAKDVGKSLAETERTSQMKRYLRSLENLILTDYLEFRWYVNGEAGQTASLARPGPAAASCLLKKAAPRRSKACCGLFWNINPSLSTHPTIWRCAWPGSPIWSATSLSKPLTRRRLRRCCGAGLLEQNSIF